MQKIMQFDVKIRPEIVIIVIVLKQYINVPSQLFCRICNSRYCEGCFWPSYKYIKTNDDTMIINVANNTLILILGKIPKNFDNILSHLNS